MKRSPGRPPTYPWRELEVGEDFTIPAGGVPTLASLRNMACQVARRHQGLRFRVSPVPLRGRYVVTRIA